MHSAASEQETSSWLVSDGLKELELLLREAERVVQDKGA